MSKREEESKYLRFLPSIYQANENTPTFLGRFLMTFEKILSGIDDGVKVDPGGQQVKGIEEILDKIHEKFDPDLTDASFLPWLAGWVALPLKEGEGWSDARKRELIAKIIPLYQKRGTKEGLEEYLKIYVGEGVRIIDELGPFQIGVSSRVGVDTVIDGLPLCYFFVDVPLSTHDPQKRREIENSIREIIDIEKPAHTHYRINFNISTMQVGYAQVEVSTLLWENQN
jgi:phage tail-like protein